MSRLFSLTLLSCALLALAITSARAEDAKADDTPAAAKTRKLLKTKISVDIKNTRLQDAIQEIKDEVKGISFIFDTAGGVSLNRMMTVKATDKAVEDVLDEMFAKQGLGYIVISKKGNAYDGAVQIRQGKERGFPLK